MCGPLTAWQFRTTPLSPQGCNAYVDLIEQKLLRSCAFSELFISHNCQNFHWLPFISFLFFHGSYLAAFTIKLATKCIPRINDASRQIHFITPLHCRGHLQEPHQWCQDAHQAHHLILAIILGWACITLQEFCPWRSKWGVQFLCSRHQQTPHCTQRM